jgi:hypothetical protein
VTTSYAFWLLVLSLAAANVPFLSPRLFGFWSVRQAKSLGMRLLELVVIYLAVGATGIAMEKHLGQTAPQGWEFYAITFTLFVTFAFPGFVYRYLLKRRD